MNNTSINLNVEENNFNLEFIIFMIALTIFVCLIYKIIVKCDIEKEEIDEGDREETITPLSIQEQRNKVKITKEEPRHSDSQDFTKDIILVEKIREKIENNRK